MGKRTNSKSVDAFNAVVVAVKSQWRFLARGGALLAAALAVPLAGCIKEDYEDPQDFAEKYIREDFEKHCPRKLWKLLQYEDVKLENVKSKMTQSLGGPVNQIVCEVRIIPEKRAKHYERATNLNWSFAWGLGYVSPLAESYLPPGLAKEIETKVQKMDKKKPLLVRRIEVGARKPGDCVDTITCYRTRDEHGVFVPLSVGEKDFIYEGVLYQFNPMQRFGDKILKQMGGLDVDEPDGRAAYVAFSNRCMKIKASLVELNELVKQMQNVTNEVRWGAKSFAQNRRAELYKSQVAPLELELKELNAAYTRRCSERERRDRDWKRQLGSLEYDRKRLVDTQAGREKDRARMTARLEQLREASAKEQRQRQLQNMQREMSGIETKLETLAKNSIAGEARLGELAAQQGAIRDAIAKQAAEASADKEDTAAKTGAAKERIEAQTREVSAKVAEESKSRLDLLAKKLQACVDELKKLL